MNINVTIPDRTNKEINTLYYKYEDKEFPVLCIGIDSYIWNSKINTGIEFTINDGYIVNNFHIGNFVSIATDNEFCMGINHNYLNVAMGVSDLFVKDNKKPPRYKNKGQILIQNDVWLGHDVTVMPGVIIHNGAVVAANSHVVKDVPPYALVGGNPAKVIGYRFDKDLIEKLLVIQWWNWDTEKIRENREFFFNEDIEGFCSKFYEEALEEKNNVEPIEIDKLENTYLFFPDFVETYSVWEEVIEEFFLKFKNKEDHMLIIYIDQLFADNNQRLINTFNQYISKKVEFYSAKCSIKVYVDNKERERSIFRNTDYYITNRSKETMLRSCYADENNVKIISGADRPIF